MSRDIEKIYEYSKPREVGVSRCVGESVAAGDDEGA